MSYTERLQNLQKKSIYISKFNFSLIIIGFLIFIIIIISSLKINNYNSSKDYTDEEILKNFSKKNTFAKDETPEIRTIYNIDELKKQNENQTENAKFYKNAKNGDKILIFKNKKIALIYRPKTQEILNISPVSVESESKNTSTATTTTTNIITSTNKPSTSNLIIKKYYNKKISDKYHNSTYHFLNTLTLKVYSSKSSMSSSVRYSRISSTSSGSNSGVSGATSSSGP